MMQWKQSIQVTLASFCFVASICVSAIPKWYSSIDQDTGIKREYGLWRECTQDECHRFSSIIPDQWIYLLQAASILSIVSSAFFTVSLFRPCWRGYVRYVSGLSVLLGLAMILMAVHKFNDSRTFSRGPCFHLCIAVMVTEFFLCISTLKMKSEHSADDDQLWIRTEFFKFIPSIHTRYSKAIRLVIALTATIFLGCSTFMMRWEHVKCQSPDTSATADFTIGIWRMCYKYDDGYYQHGDNCFFSQQRLMGLRQGLTINLNLVQSMSSLALCFSLWVTFIEGNILGNARKGCLRYFCICTVLFSSAICLVVFKFFVSQHLPVYDDFESEVCHSSFGESFYLPMGACVLLFFSVFVAEPKPNEEGIDQPLLENV